MKKIVVLIAVLLFVGLVLAAVTFLRLDPTALGATVIARVSQKTGLRIEADRFALHPVHGLEISEATVTGKVLSGRVTANIEVLRIRHQFLPLMWGELVLDEVLLQSPTVELVTRSIPGEGQGRKVDRQARKQKRRDKKRQAGTGDRSSAQALPGQGDGLRLSIRSLRIDSGTLLIRTTESVEEDFSLEDLRLVLQDLTFDPSAESSTQALSGRGQISTGRIIQGDLEAQMSKGSLNLAAGVADLTDIEVETLNADLRVTTLTVYLDRQPPTYTLSSAGSLDLNGVVGSDDRDGFGPVAIQLEAAGQGPELRQMAGTGALTLEGGSIPEIPSIVQIEELVGQPLLTGRIYEAFTIDYRLKENKIHLEPFELAGEDARIGGSGEIDLTGLLDLEIFVRLQRSALVAGGLSEEQLEPLADEEGMVTVPFQITGKVEDPAVSLSWDGMQEITKDAARTWAEQALEEAKRKAAEWLKQQTEKNDDD